MSQLMIKTGMLHSPCCIRGTLQNVGMTLVGAGEPA